eukprot:748533-Hanusia_phi.AAC.3
MRGVKQVEQDAKKNEFDSPSEWLTCDDSSCSSDTIQDNRSIRIACTRGTGTRPRRSSISLATAPSCRSSRGSLAPSLPVAAHRPCSSPPSAASSGQSLGPCAERASYPAPCA